MDELKGLERSASRFDLLNNVSRVAYADIGDAEIP